MSYRSTPSFPPPDIDAPVAYSPHCTVHPPPLEPPNALVSPFFEILKVTDRVRADGKPLLGLHLRLKRFPHITDQPITCAFYPQAHPVEGHIREVSAQLGCLIGCDFCGCGDLRDNLTPEEVREQIRLLTVLAAGRGVSLSDPFKTNFSDGGEVLLNPGCMEILKAARETPDFPIKISTVLPVMPRARHHLDQMLEQIQDQGLNIHLQISMYSTDEARRQASSRRGVRLFSDPEIRELGQRYLEARPDHRKATLSFTLKDDSHCVPAEIRETLPPEFFVIRLHPYKPNNVEPRITPLSDEACAKLQLEFESLGYTVFRDRYDPVEQDWLNVSGTRALALAA